MIILDNKINIEQLKEFVKKFCEDRDWEQFHNPKDLVISLSTESNELLSLFKFKDTDDMKGIFSNPQKGKDEHVLEVL